MCVGHLRESVTKLILAPSDVRQDDLVDRDVQPDRPRQVIGVQNHPAVSVWALPLQCSRPRYRKVARNRDDVERRISEVPRRRQHVRDHQGPEHRNDDRAASYQSLGGPCLTARDRAVHGTVMHQGRDGEQAAECHHPHPRAGARHLWAGRSSGDSIASRAHATRR